MTQGTGTGAPDIRCNRCGTLTTWNPYCPTCGAYLEFAGVPPWEPGQKFSTPPSLTAPMAGVEGNLGEPGHGVRHLWLHGEHREGHHREQDSENPSAQPPSLVQARDTGGGESEGTSRLVAAVSISSPVAEMPGVPMAPALRTSAMVMLEGKDSVGGPTCERCHRRNPIWRAYCERCGMVFPHAILAPPRAHESEEGGGHHEKKDSGKGPHRSSWWKKVVVGIILCGLIYVIWYYFFGPAAPETRTNVTIQIQRLWEKINPNGGVSAPVKTVVANNSLDGTTAMSLADPAARTFWASAPNQDFGAGSTITVTFATPVEIDRLFIYPGIQNGQLDIRALATPQEITLEFSPTLKITSTLAPVVTQEAHKQLISFPRVTTSTVTITINSVYPPLYLLPDQTVGEVAISALDFLQLPSVNTALGGLVPSTVVPSGAPTSASTSVPTSVPAIKPPSLP